MVIKKLVAVAALLFAGNNYCSAQTTYPLFEPVNFSNVNVTDKFWKPKMEKVATATLKACIYQTETATPRILNFEIAAGRKQGKFKGNFYDDASVYKAIEAMAYSIKSNPDLEKKIDEWVDIVVAAQKPDGYLNTYYSIQFPEKKWTDMAMHEDYMCGLLIEAGLAYYDATGKRKLLDAGIKFANYFSSMFGPGKKHWVTGHEELELALVKLYKFTGEKKYLEEADWLLGERGRGLGKGYTWGDWKDTAYAQDLRPVKEQTEITGHAVRAMYLYTGTADVAAMTGDAGYMNAMKKVWEDVVYRNMYVTGGIGSSGSNEGFSKDYDLPNERAYCETCASVGMVFWNQRMNFLTGDSKYIDVLERSLYNAALDGLSISGDLFFYGNPLASKGQHARREWFSTACCPSNIARLVSALGNYIYAKSDNGIWVNLFVGSNTKVKIGNNEVALAMNTAYPLDGKIQLAIDPSSKASFAMHLRIPGWVANETATGGLYHFADQKETSFAILVNGQPAKYEMENGYAVINKEWKKGDKIELVLPMEVKRISSRQELRTDTGRVALQRGPLVYCVEGADNGGKAWNIAIPEKTAFTVSSQNILTEPVMAIKMQVPVLQISADGTNVQTENKVVTAIPYYTWANRGKGQMQVWLPVRFTEMVGNQ